MPILTPPSRGARVAALLDPRAARRPAQAIAPRRMAGAAAGGDPSMDPSSDPDALLGAGGQAGQDADAWGAGGANDTGDAGDTGDQAAGGYTICISVAADGRMAVHSEPGLPQPSADAADATDPTQQAGPQGAALADQPGAAGLAAALSAGAPGRGGAQGGAGAPGDAGDHAPTAMPVKDFKAAIQAAFDIYKAHGAMPETSDADMQSAFQAGYQGAAL